MEEEYLAKYAPKPEEPVQPRRSFFGNSPTVRYGLIVVAMTMLFLHFYKAMYEGKHLRGPIDDFYRKKYSNMTVLYPTGGERAADSLVEAYARKVAAGLEKKLSTRIPVQADREANDRTRKRKSLLLYGPVEDNRLLRRIQDDLPIRFRDGRVCRADGSVIDRTDWRLVFVAPNPYNNTQYVLVYTAASPELLVGINYVGNPNYVPHDTTDYVLAAGDSILASGFFDKDSTRGTWSLPAGAFGTVGR